MKLIVNLTVLLLYGTAIAQSKIVVDISKKDSITVCAGQILELTNDSTKADTSLCSSQGAGTIKWKNGATIVGMPVSKYVTPPMMGDSTYTWNYVDASGNQKPCCAVRTFKVKVTPAGKVTWGESPKNKWGFDAPNKSDNNYKFIPSGTIDTLKTYINLPFLDTNWCNISINPFQIDRYWLTVSDSTSISINDINSIPLTVNNTEFKITSRNPRRASTLHTSSRIYVRCGSKYGVIIDTLFVEVYKYKIKFDTLFYFRVWDSTSKNTLPESAPTYLLDSINHTYKQLNAGVKNLKIDTLFHISYDKNKNGFLDYYKNKTSLPINPERDAIINRFTRYANNGVIQVKRFAFRANWVIDRNIRKGTKTIFMNVNTVNIGQYLLGYPNGVPENIEIISIGTNFITLKDTVKNNYSKDSVTIYYGLGGLSTSPILVINPGSNMASVIVHEFSHLPTSGDFSDVIHADNVMHYSTAGSRNKIRYRPAVVVKTGTNIKTGTYEKHWNQFTR